MNQVEVGSIIPNLNKQFGSNVYKVNKHRLKKCLIRILLSFISEKLKHVHRVISYSSRYPTHSSFINMLCFANIHPIVDNCLFFSQFMPTTIKFVLIRRNTCQADRIDAIAYLLCTWKHLWLHTQCFDWIMSFFQLVKKLHYYNFICQCHHNIKLADCICLLPHLKHIDK